MCVYAFFYVTCSTLVETLCWSMNQHFASVLQKLAVATVLTVAAILSLSCTQIMQFFTNHVDNLSIISFLLIILELFSIPWPTLKLFPNNY